MTIGRSSPFRCRCSGTPVCPEAGRLWGCVEAAWWRAGAGLTSWLVYERAVADYLTHIGLPVSGEAVA